MLSCVCTIFVAILVIVVISSADIFTEKLQNAIIKEFKDVDADHDNEVTIEEVMTHWQEHVRRMTEQQVNILREGYKQADLDHNGRVNLTEFQVEVYRVLANPFPKMHQGIFGGGRTMMNVGQLKNVVYV